MSDIEWVDTDDVEWVDTADVEWVDTSGGVVTAAEVWYNQLLLLGVSN